MSASPDKGDARGTPPEEAGAAPRVPARGGKVASARLETPRVLAEQARDAAGQGLRRAGRSGERAFARLSWARARKAARDARTVAGRLADAGAEAGGRSADALEREASTEVDHAADMASRAPEAAWRSARAVHDLHPATRASAATGRWDAKAAATDAKAAMYATKAKRAAARSKALEADGAPAKVVEHERGHARRMKEREYHSRRKAARLRGAEGTGVRGAVMGARRAAAGLVRDAFGPRALMGVLVPALAIVLAVSLVGSCAAPVMLLVASGGTSSASAGTLVGNEAIVASVLRELGYSDVQIAAMLGNAYAESGCDPTKQEAGGGGGYGIFQFTPPTSMRAWCEANGFDSDSAEGQVRYVDAVLHGSWLTGLHAAGYYDSYVPGEYASADASWSAWESVDDVGLATYMFMACYERCSNVYCHFAVRYEHALEVYAALQSGGLGGYGEGQAYADASSSQRAIVTAANGVSSPGQGWCARWVSLVYQAAGYGYIGGDADDMYYAYCKSSDTDDLMVGMIVATTPSKTSSIGHVGIYIGDGCVISNVGYIKVETLEEWVSNYDKTGNTAWGWPCAVDTTD